MDHFKYLQRYIQDILQEISFVEATDLTANFDKMKLFESIRAFCRMENVAFYDHFYIKDILQTSHHYELAIRIINRFAQILHLEFNNNTIYSNVCHLDHHLELRDEYKISFSIKDVGDYIGGYLLAKGHKSKSLINNFDDIIILYPVNRDFFWKCAKYYSAYKQLP